MPSPSAFVEVVETLADDLTTPVQRPTVAKVMNRFNDETAGTP
jgi:hypothetical protein